MPSKPSPKSLPFQNPHNPSFHAGRSTFKGGSVDVDLGLGHNNVIMTGAPIIRSRTGTNVAATVEGGINLSRSKKGILTFSQKKADGTDAGATTAVMLGGAGPYNVSNGHVTRFNVNGSGLQTKTWVGTAAQIVSSGATYAALSGKTLTFLNAGGVGIPGSVTFSGAAVDRATAIIEINAAMSPNLVAAPDGASEISFTSGLFGTSSRVTVDAAGPTNTSLAALGLVAGQTASGTGDAPYLNAMTRAQAAIALNASFTGLVFDGSGPQLSATTVTTGSTASINHPNGDTAPLGFPSGSTEVGEGGDLTIEWACVASDPVPVS